MLQPANKSDRVRDHMLLPMLLTVSFNTLLSSVQHRFCLAVP